MKAKTVAVWVGLTLALYAINWAHPVILSVFWTGRWVDGPALQKTLNVMVALAAISHALAGALIGHWYGQKWLGLAGTSLVTVLCAYVLAIAGSTGLALLTGPFYDAYMSGDTWMLSTAVWALASVVVASVLGRVSARSRARSAVPA